VRLRHRTMTGQSCPSRLADAVGRCSLAGDSERPAPWNFCVPAEDRESTAPGRCSCPTGTLRLSVVAALPSSRSSTLNPRSCSSSDARARAGSAATPASAQEPHSCRDRRECSSHGEAALCLSMLPDGAAIPTTREEHSLGRPTRCRSHGDGALSPAGGRAHGTRPERRASMRFRDARSSKEQRRGVRCRGCGAAPLSS
jgi:hypothetical protein